MQQHHQILIIGGGNAGISVAAQLLRKRKSLQIAIMEPSDKHYYQPAWTLVGAGTFDIHDTVRSEASVMPSGVNWIKEAAAKFEPESNKVISANGNEYTYDYLVVAPGIQLNWHLVKGLPETLGRNGVTSNYSFDLAPYTFELLKGMKEGDTALFTSPGTPVKCGGAPQKIMYLTADYLRKHGLQGKTKVEFVTAGGVIFGIKKYADQLMKKVNEYGIELHFKHDLVEIDGPGKTATFKVTDPQGVSSYITKHFDMIHVVPPQSAPDFIKSSPLANEAGWVDVHKFTLQHNRFPNIFGLGDATSTPNAKTGAAVRKQAPVLVKNLLAVIDGQPLQGNYTGYGSCPLVVGYGQLILAEFDYDNKPMETFPFDQAKPRWSMWALKKYVLPWMYWNKILKGTA
ncbi:NAD(P)/FAD-dependent oxidoreductase [Flavihumibacter sp. RY-1]|uniref:NAD(P)/FAD-dependent oxidoreductase n=1 Tax=Flavihumibacter fluminis TaxID=2909236 RepID=A0ABS9BIT5_9BACT|nr:FAD/NAD(P)-binding oxidoreductase [Flavihumibacter fluminis]MCF1715626.1 NAD(P)/FAD-dependent oxidoreductase [Flavihumibacter fluminis]